jgi:hypothetical protein
MKFVNPGQRTNFMEIVKALDTLKRAREEQAAVNQQRQWAKEQHDWAVEDRARTQTERDKMAAMFNVGAQAMQPQSSMEPAYTPPQAAGRVSFLDNVTTPGMSPEDAINRMFAYDPMSFMRSGMKLKDPWEPPSGFGHPGGWYFDKNKELQQVPGSYFRTPPPLKKKELTAKDITEIIAGIKKEIENNPYITEAEKRAKQAEIDAWSAERARMMPKTTDNVKRAPKLPQVMMSPVGGAINIPRVNPSRAMPPVGSAINTDSTNQSTSVNDTAWFNPAGPAPEDSGYDTLWDYYLATLAYNQETDSDENRKDFAELIKNVK